MGNFTSLPVEDGSSYYANIQDNADFMEEVKILNGHEINLASWLPKAEVSVKGVVICAHGLHEHALRHYKIAAKLCEEGMAVYIPEHGAHGKSYGTRGLIESADALVEDFCASVDYVKSLHPTLPTVLLAHSMGTMVGLAAIGRLPKDTFRAAVFSATAFVPGFASASPFGCSCLHPLTTTSIADWMTGCLAYCDPKGPAAPLMLSYLRTDLEQIELIEHDPWQYKGWVMNKTAAEFLKLKKTALSSLETMSTPFLALHATEDKITLLKGAEMLMENATYVSQKRLIQSDCLVHEVLQETPDAAAEIVEFLVRASGDDLESWFTTKQEPEHVPLSLNMEIELSIP
jgi:acylglycerol lipase